VFILIQLIVRICYPENGQSVANGQTTTSAFHKVVQ